jgi:hypothetical protein
VGGMEDSTIQKINDYIDEFFFMEKGEIISNPRERILFSGNIYISRRSLKHIVEQRSINDGLDACGIKLLIKRARGMLIDPEMIIKNKNKKYPNSLTFGKFDFGADQGVLAIVDTANGSQRVLITIFYKEEKQFLKLVEKNSP